MSGAGAVKKAQAIAARSLVADALLIEAGRRQAPRSGGDEAAFDDAHAKFPANGDGHGEARALEQATTDADRRGD